MFRSKAEKKVIDAGYDPARLPPGQYLTEKWPVLHAGSVPHTELETWDFRVWGEVEQELTLDWQQLAALPTVEVTQDIHCVTRWSKFDLTFKGIAWRELETLAGQKPSARYAIAHAEQGFTANVPIAVLRAEGALLAYEADGEPLGLEHGWPLRLVIPGKYFWKSAKWLRGIELSVSDKPGFWERYGYHNDADPFKEQRYAF
ncbi:MAG: sulfite oxidase-like oxidoreductase [Gaiellaceae bacterium MAG52_C11]|nr:sulfite oxidase-like oxidoreductase [Candidatus Gaiellasilicea maunaloa]